MIPVFLVQKGGFLMRKTVLNMIAVIGVSVLCTISSFAATGGPGVVQISETEVSTEMVRKNPETMTAEEIIDDLYHNMGHTELIRCAKDNAALLTGEKAVVDNSGYMLIGIYNDASVMYDAAYPLGTEQQTIGVRSDGTYAALLSYTDYPTEAKQKENKEALNYFYQVAWDLREATDEMTDREKVVYLADWIHSHITERVVGLEGQPATRLMSRVADCDGHASLFHVFATFCGIPTKEVMGTWKGGNHAWNRVFVDGEWLFADAVSNQTLFSADEAATMQYVEKSVLYKTIEEAKNSGYTIQ